MLSCVYKTLELGGVEHRRHAKACYAQRSYCTRRYEMQAFSLADERVLLYPHSAERRRSWEARLDLLSVKRKQKRTCFFARRKPRIIGVFLLCERLRFTSVFEYQSGEASFGRIRSVQLWIYNFYCLI